MHFTKSKAIFWIPSSNEQEHRYYSLETGGKDCNEIRVPILVKLQMSSPIIRGRQIYLFVNMQTHLIMYIRNTVILSFEAPAQIEKKMLCLFFCFFNFVHRKVFMCSHGNISFVSLFWKFLWDFTSLYMRKEIAIYKTGKQKTFSYKLTAFFYFSEEFSFPTWNQIHYSRKLQCTYEMQYSPNYLIMDIKILHYWFLKWL